MKKINFKNYPDTSTPLSAETFNLMQDNIEDEFDLMQEKINGDVLFENTQGLNDNISLSKSTSNYKILKIDYSITLGDYSVKGNKTIDANAGTQFVITENLPHSEILVVIDTAMFNLNSNTIIKNRELDYRIQSGGTIIFTGTVDRIKITKVIGYKN